MTYSKKNINNNLKKKKKNIKLIIDKYWWSFLIPIIAGIILIFIQQKIFRSNDHEDANINEKQKVDTLIQIKDTVLQKSNRDSTIVNFHRENIELSFFTDKIENQKFIFTNKHWPFPVNSLGEDIKNPLTPEIERIQIVPKYAFKYSYVTIANQYIWIRFHILNSGEYPVFLENLYINVLNKYNTSDSMFYNEWMPYIEEHEYLVVLNSNESLYKIADNPIKIETRCTEHFFLKITGDSSCTNTIFYFQILGYFHDSFGKKRKLQSNKNYYLGFLSSNPYK